MAIYNFILQAAGYENLVPKFFGKGEPFEPNDLALPQQQGRTERYMNTNRRDELKTSWLGTPVFADMILASQDGKTDVGLTIALVEISGAKIVERTEVRGRRGRVHQYFAVDDYAVRITGALMTDKPNFYPEEDVAKMVSLVERLEPINVVSRLLQLFDIYELTVENWQFLPIGDKTNMQLFELNCWSHLPIEFITES